MSHAPVYIEIDGRPAADPELIATLQSAYGHFTAMQVRHGGVRGLGLHLDRLDGASRELFGTGVDKDHVRALMRQALRAAGRAEAAVRVYMYEGTAMVTVREPFAFDDAPQALKSVPYQRPAAHLKHLGGFGQTYHREAVRREGFDEALLTAPDGTVSEGAVTNIAFWDGASVRWPDAPALHGVTMALLEPLLGSVRGPVTLADVPSFRAAFVTNSRGIAPVSRIDETVLPGDERLMARVREAYASVEWETL
ncbi:aminotransferase class IV [Streptomyces purpureus]|uniref:Class IV aminotransferase n=1 Tax=Streptomyces purpureus TaxID=1951 RepID=A0A918LTR8_9ACTN|nr:aminotransferase class IV [Streptomyces purpureus]GGT48043.1 hypothetical protein GCM10014713_47840 [Streptomyces purpureus]